MTDASEPQARPARRPTAEWPLVRTKPAPANAETTWGPYYDALHPPRLVHFIVDWKVVPKQMDYVAGLWRRRQELRRAYQAEYGTDPALWPSRHPGAVLDDHPICLGCQWIHEPRGYYRADGVFQYPIDLARRHEASNGSFRGGEAKKPTARWLTSPPPVETPPIPRRSGPIPRLRVVERYESGIRRRWAENQLD